MISQKLEQRAVWLNFVIRSETDLPTNCCLCSKHFSKDDFDKSSSKKVQLRKNCVRTISVLRVKYARECDPSFVSVSPVYTNKPIILQINHKVSDVNMPPKIKSPTFEEGYNCLNTNCTPKKQKQASHIETSMNSTPKKRQNSVTVTLPTTSQ
ncbi:hypothetical protein FQA39_LY03344 [Lamprigera yunnana]|nr:hypothetical protein FQA39_LY03344 [Lamprigera yunnana]